MTEIMTIEGVRGYEKGGTAYLNVEDVARGLGFTQVAASGNEVVRWERVNKYLADFKFVPTSGDGVKAEDYIPENMFYRLAMKAKNEVAEAFQAKVADEILPAIRKHGLYATPLTIENIIANPDFGIELLKTLKVEREERERLQGIVEIQEVQIAELTPKASYYDLILNCKDLVPVTQIAKDYGLSAVQMNKILQEMGVQFNRRGMWILYQEYAKLGWTSTKTHIYTSDDGVKHAKAHTYWTQKGRIGLYELLKREGYLPTIEQVG